MAAWFYFCGKTVTAITCGESPPLRFSSPPYRWIEEYKESVGSQDKSESSKTSSEFQVSNQLSSSNMKTVALVCVAVFAVSIQLASARPRFLAIPLEDVEFLEVEAGGRHATAPLIRLARAAKEQQWAEERRDDQQVEATEDGRFQRGIHGGGSGGGGGGEGGQHDYVDFGAHTGHHGAFGWYADFPVQKDH